MVDTTVHLLRHGEVHNPDHILYGRSPGFVLTARGHQMAEAAARHFAGSGALGRCDVVHVVASPLERAQLTAAPVAAEFGLGIGTDERIIEADNTFEGNAVSVRFLLRPKNLLQLWNPWRPSWGEPYLDIARRMRSAILAARTAAHGHEAVLVSHQLPIWVARISAENRSFLHDPRRRVCALGSVTSFHFDDTTLRWVSYSEPVMVERS